MGRRNAQPRSWIRPWRAGFRGVDTACQPRHYDEPGVGVGLQSALAELGLQRSDIYVQTKYTPVSGQDPRRIPYDRMAPLATQVMQSCATSLANLQTGWLDGLVLHSPLATDRDLMVVWRAMESLCDEGKVCRLGISNCYDPRRLAKLQDAARIPPAIVQNRFYAETGYDREIRAFCREHRIAYQSFWTLTANPHLLAAPAVRTLARRYRVEPAQILFRCLTQIGVTPLTGTTSLAHMQADLAMFDFELVESECMEVVALFEPAAG